jgi:hypothetical protein
MNDAANIETVLVGIFDDAQDLDRAAKRLGEEGFGSEIFDNTVVIEDPRSVDPLPVGTVLAVGPDTGERLEGLEPDLAAITRRVKSLLADYDFPNEVIESYATMFSRNAKLGLVRTEPELADRATEILRECKASRVDRYD